MVKDLSDSPALALGWKSKPLLREKNCC